MLGEMAIGRGSPTGYRGMIRTAHGGKDAGVDTVVGFTDAVLLALFVFFPSVTRRDDKRGMMISPVAFAHLG